MMDMADWKTQLESLLADMPPVDNASAELPEQKPAQHKLPLLRVEKDKRKGKTATLVTGHDGTDEEVAALAKHLKVRLAVGGSVRDGEILLQGDVREKTAALLQELGYKVKLIQ